MHSINLETFDLTQLPTKEDDYFEFKSSATSFDDLNEKLSRAASGFANSGGGYFIAGVDGNGNADGGIPLKKGRQDLRDWVDQVVRRVEPTPRYEIKLIQDSTGRGSIQSDSAVLVVAIYESYAGPHMAHDYHYYIRAGAHTVKAKHFIIDAIWAKRHFSKPRLTHQFRLKPEKDQVIQLGVVALTDAPAINVSINISPLPELMRELESLFPLTISVIDRSNPFFFDVVTYFRARELFGDNVNLEVEYYDLSGNLYSYNTAVEVSGSVTPLSIGTDHDAKMVEQLKAIHRTLSSLATLRERVNKPSLIQPKHSENVFLLIENQIPELLATMRDDLHEHPLIREFIIRPENTEYGHNPHNPIFHYYFEDHPWLRGKLRILENYGLIYDITYNDTPRFVITEEFAAYLTNPLP